MSRCRISFLVLSVLLCINQMLEECHVIIYPLHCYADDLLCIPWMLSAYQSIREWQAVKSGKQFELETWMYVMPVIFFSIYFEGILPYFHPRFTADVIDILMYASGSLLYAGWQRHSYSISNVPSKTLIAGPER
ncbi:MAG: hypothetical protein IAE67_00790 [Candidatus Competibacteraceae bacterium]|nr:hypothetical protein [Candidatus Competibacteraceae bacterium]